MSERTLGKRVLFWLGVVLLVFGGIINIALILMEIYPEIIMGVIVSLFTVMFGMLSIFSATRTTDAITSADRLFFLAIILLTVVPIIFTIWGWFSYLIIIPYALLGVVGIAAWLIIERASIRPTWTNVGAIILILILIFAFLAGFWIYHIITDLDFFYSFAILSVTIAYALVQALQPEAPSGELWGWGEIPKTEMDSQRRTRWISDDMSKRLFQFLMLTVLFIVSGAILWSGILFILSEWSIEFILLGWVFLGLSIGLIGMAIGLAAYFLYRSVAKPDANRPRLAILILMIAIGVGTGFLVGYILFGVFAIV